jgi:ribonuclease III
VTPSTTWSPNWKRPETGDDPAVVDGARDPAAPAPEEALTALARRLGWEVRDAGLLVQALSHRSWCAEVPGTPSNERLEFLGDAVLGLVVAEHCYRAYPDMPEGALAKVRAAVVNTAVLAEMASGLDLGAALLLGRGEDASGGRRKASILANAAEAVIGAVFLDQGWDVASRVVLDMLDDRIELAAAGPGAEDFKTRLQEVVLRTIGELPRYELEGTGPDHARRYRARVLVAGAERGVGEGRSKKDAEQAAARVAWPVLVGREDAEGGIADPREAPGAPAGHDAVVEETGMPGAERGVRDDA